MILPFGRRKGSFLLSEDMSTLEMFHRLHVHQPVAIEAKFVVRSDPFFIVFLHYFAISRDFEKPFPTFAHLIGIVNERLDGCLQAARLGVRWWLGLHQLTACHLVEHLAIYLEHGANLTGDEELKAGDGEHVSYLIVATPRIYLLAIVSVLLAILGKQDEVNTFNK